jgi:serine protease Do
MMDLTRIDIISRRIDSRVLMLVLMAAVIVFTVLPAKAHESFSELTTKLSPSVVNISTTRVVEGERDDFPTFPPGSPFEDFLEEFRKRGGEQQSRASGSGFVIDKKGLVVTNNHVIEDADKIWVTLHNDKTFDAVLVGRDPKTDLAVLQIEPDGEPLKVASFGDSDSLKVGDWVLAIGNPFGLGGSVTAGIVSARGRDIGSGPYDDFIQTDAAINRGNSGGPLFNLEGEVIGINTAIFSQTGGSVGIGFAIASNLATNVVDQLEEFGRTRRGWLGVFIQEITPDIAESLGLKTEIGALVSSVHPEGPAHEGGIETGDIVVEFDGKKIVDMRSLPRTVAETAIGKDVKVKVVRDGKEVSLTVKLGELEQAEESGLLANSVPSTGGSYTFGNLGFIVDPLDQASREKFGLSAEVNGRPLTGAVVSEVVPGSPAAERGLEAGDVIRSVNQRQITQISDLIDGVNEARNLGKTSVLLLVYRNDNERFVAMPVN